METLDRKKIFIGAVVLLFITLLFFLVFRNRNKNEPSVNPTTQTQESVFTTTPTTIVEQISPISQVDNQILNTIKQKIADTYVFESITLDYAPKSNTILIYHAITQKSAREQFETFLAREGLDDLTFFKTSYIDLSAKTPDRQY